MDSDLVRQFITDAHHIYQVCAVSLGVPNGGSDLSKLLHFANAQRNDFQRLGEVTSETGAVYAYHVHGAGYSFRDLQTGKEIHFDIMLVNGVFQMRLSRWKLHRYAVSIGQSLSEQAAQSELNRVSATESFLVHVTDGPFEYYTVPKLGSGPPAC